ncbi:glycoside hydrolase [Croceibacterium mercuriale]|uniref:Glycoside hydrolase n=1 Tax=Croceibacterium mercuriale TaxID=1572751 RepID=A0A0B2BZ67_9SPHN|nr:glycoside hydrolase family 43 protein [Croceibacterium mercuriale]KHL25135.1 glycoside hydrolase [Croceibacterium mercuriale]
MRSRFSHIVPALALALLAPGCMAPPLSSASAGTTGAYPLLLPQMPLHDPFIVADADTGTYHLFTRNEAAMTGDRRLGTMAYASRDLKHWSHPRVVFALPEGTWADGGAWAPEVHQWRGRWYLFTTFHNEAAALPAEPGSRRTPHRRGTLMAVADSPAGPFTLANDGEPVVPASRMTLDGTLHVDAEGRPWFVYAHEWVQTTVGTIEAVPLDDDLRPIGEPQLLFRADAADWARGQPQPQGDTVWVTDGPQFFRTAAGTLVMLWSSYGERGYVQALARSTSGTVTGPWEQLGPLVQRDSGHGMLFRAFDGRLMLVVHRPFTNALGKLYEMRDADDRVEVIREATELDLEAYPTHR